MRIYIYVAHDAAASRSEPAPAGAVAINDCEPHVCARLDITTRRAVAVLRKVRTTSGAPTQSPLTTA
eukprot:11197162-Lingulodinium_polyedra.AAC.1